MPLAATTAAAAAAPATAVDALPGLGSTALSLMLVLIVIFALAALLKRLQGVRSGGSGGLRIHAGLQVGAKERVLMIEAGGKHLLVGVSAAGVQTLHVYDAPPALTEAPRAEGSHPPFATAFVEVLKRSLGQSSKS